MRIPAIRGIIDRRVLVNFCIDPNVLHRRLIRISRLVGIYFLWPSNQYRALRWPPCIHTTRQFSRLGRLQV